MLEVAAIIVGVLAVSALLVWMLWSTFRLIENPRRLRKVFLFLGALYIVGAINGIWKVISGETTVWSLLYLPIPIALAFVYLRTASRMQTRPK